MARLPSAIVPFLCLSFLLLLAAVAESVAQPNATFSFVNSGFFNDPTETGTEPEYAATYRVSTDDKLFASPFSVCFYNTTPDAFTLAVRMGSTSHRQTTLPWVWEANRGRPVGENATFSLGRDGNLVLADGDGRVVFQSNTTGKGVVGFRFRHDGNMVLVDARGGAVWQSFNYPTDTLLVGQSLRIRGGVSRLVSRLSEKESKDGPYSLVVETKGSMSLYYTTNNTPAPMLYYASSDFSDMADVVTFEFSRDEEAGAYFFTFGPYVTARTFHNSSLSFMRLGIDGNIRIFTYNEGVLRRAFTVAFSFFDRQVPRAETECQLPEKCGALGVCEDSQCVACPTERGLLGWSRECGSKRATSCRVGAFRYFKIVGVNHFLSQYTEGESMRESECGKKCSSECKCLGYFYHRESSKCWVANELKTLTKVANSTHLGFIKTPIA